MNYEVNVKITYNKKVKVEANSKENAITLSKAEILKKPSDFSPNEDDILTLGVTNVNLLNDKEEDDEF